MRDRPAAAQRLRGRSLEDLGEDLEHIDGREDALDPAGAIEDDRATELAVGRRRRVEAFGAMFAAPRSAPAEPAPAVTGCAALLQRGDVAVHAGDARALRHVAMLLSGRVGDPFEAKLRELACTCDREPARSLAAWPALRDAVVDRIAVAGT